MADKRRIDEATGTSTVGHEWDGIEELNTPLPRWWLWTFYLTIIWALGYAILYPAWPMVHSATKGVLGWSSRGQLEKELAAEAQRAAIQGGGAAFRVHCVQCHGAGGAGVKKLYPNLTDDDWLWGGDLAAIHYTITNGIRNPDVKTTRTSQMPAFGRDGILDAKQIDDLVSHVRVISRQEKPSASSARGAALFSANCAVCHGAGGEGGRSVGAPKLTDAIWLYGGDFDSIRETVWNARYGQMPGWSDRLTEAQIRAVATYVHQLGGGE